MLVFLLLSLVLLVIIMILLLIPRPLSVGQGKKTLISKLNSGKRFRRSRSPERQKFYLRKSGIQNRKLSCVLTAWLGLVCRLTNEKGACQRTTRDRDTYTRIHTYRSSGKE